MLYETLGRVIPYPERRGLQIQGLRRPGSWVAACDYQFITPNDKDQLGD